MCKGKSRHSPPCMLTASISLHMATSISHVNVGRVCFVGPRMTWERLPPERRPRPRLATSYGRPPERWYFHLDEVINGVKRKSNRTQNSSSKQPETQTLSIVINFSATHQKLPR